MLKRLKSSEIVADEFVTGGVDSRVVLWKLRGEHVEYVADLTGCDGSVGSVCGCVEDGRKVVAAAWVRFRIAKKAAASHLHSAWFFMIFCRFEEKKQQKKQRKHKIVFKNDKNGQIPSVLFRKK